MKNIIIILLFGMINLVSYGQSEKMIQHYLDTITCYVEGNNNRLSPCKYNQDVLIYVDGDKQPHLMVEINKVIKELNNLITSIDIKMVDNKSKCNMYVYFGSKRFKEEWNIKIRMKTYINLWKS